MDEVAALIVLEAKRLHAQGEHIVLTEEQFRAAILEALLLNGMQELPSLAVPHARLA